MGRPFTIKITQLRLERNYGEAIRLLQARQAQFHFASQHDKGFDQVALAFMQRLAGDTAGAKVTAEQARNTLEQLYRDQPDNFGYGIMLSQAYAVMGEKDLALKVAERAIMLLPRAKDQVDGPALEENLAFIQVIFGENSRAISTLTQLLQTPYVAGFMAQRPLRRHFLGSIRSGILCAAIPLSKNSARKSSREDTNLKLARFPTRSPLPVAALPSMSLIPRLHSRMVTNSSRESREKPPIL